LKSRLAQDLAAAAAAGLGIFNTIGQFGGFAASQNSSRVVMGRNDDHCRPRPR
jgi:hypothetical protein